MRVFARDGFHGAIISRIPDEAGVAPGKIYLYFDVKTDILLLDLFPPLLFHIGQA